MSKIESISFQKRLSKLNPEQLLAVETTEGPVMVVAGPGTGKTETLGARIANILYTQTDIEAGNILCLTYTTAGVVAMRKRLISFIGSSAHKIEIHTFHSFCNKIIQENSDYFPVQDAENISELSQYELLEKLLKNLPADDLHFQKNSYSYAKNLLGLFNTFKSESWEAKEVRDACALYLQELQSDENMQYKRKYTDKKSGKVYQKGDLNEKNYKAIEEKIAKVVSATHLFEKYQKALSENGQYDFQDMIIWVLDAFEKDKNFLAEYQERFQYILVDEFQDTNGSQKELVDYLCSYWDEPNIFVVGDTKQAIFRFAGASDKSYSSLLGKLSQVETIELEHNYRSHQNILNTSHSLISKSEYHKDEIKLKAFFDKGGIFQYRQFGNDKMELLYVAQDIKQRIADGQDINNIAVLYRNNKDGEDIRNLLSIYGIPVRDFSKKNILKDRDVMKIFLLLRSIYNMDDNEVVAKSLFIEFAILIEKLTELQSKLYLSFSK